MYQRQLSKALTHRDVRDLNEAIHFAEKRGKPLNTTIAIHPTCLTHYPEDVGDWVSGLLNKIRIWCERDRGFGYFALWVRENYEGDRREHLHIMLSVPENERASLEAALRRWLPGRDEVVQLGRPTFRTDRHGRRINKALTYLLKQMTPQAWVALNRQVRRESCCRKTAALVAAVMGKRCGVSRSLNRNTRKTFWATPATIQVRASQQSHGMMPKRRAASTLITQRHDSMQLQKVASCSSSSSCSCRSPPGSIPS